MTSANLFAVLLVHTLSGDVALNEKYDGSEYKTISEFTSSARRSRSPSAGSGGGRATGSSRGQTAGNKGRSYSASARSGANRGNVANAARARPNFARLTPVNVPAVRPPVTPSGVRVGRKGWLQPYLNRNSKGSHVARHIGVSAKSLQASVRQRVRNWRSRPVGKQSRVQLKPAMLQKFYDRAGPKTRGLTRLRKANAQSSFGSKRVAQQAINRAIAQKKARIDFWAASMPQGKKSRLNLRVKDAGLGAIGTHVSHNGHRLITRKSKGLFIQLVRSPAGHITPKSAYPI